MQSSDASPPGKPEDGPVISITGLEEGDAAGGTEAAAPTETAAPEVAGGLELTTVGETAREPAPEVASGLELTTVGEAAPLETVAPEVASGLELTTVGGAGAPAASEMTAAGEGAKGRELTAVGMVDPPVPWSPSLWFMTASALIVAVLDLGSKEWATRTLAGPDLKRTGMRFEVIADHLDFIFAQNPGGAWSFLRSVPDGLRRPFFLFVSAAAIVFIVSVYRRLDRRQWAMRWGLPLALGGAIGNLADRVRYGWVVDFIDFYWKGPANEFHWPTFNVADIAIVLGVGLMAIDLFSIGKLRDPVSPPRPANA